MRFTIVTTTLAFLGLAAAAPATEDKRNVNYSLRCNGDFLNQDSIDAVLEKLSHVTLGRAGANWSGSHFMYDCPPNQDNGKCAYLSLRSEDGAYQDDYGYGIQGGAKQIARACGDRGGSGPSADNDKLIIHIAGSWV